MTSSSYLFLFVVLPLVLALQASDDCGTHPRIGDVCRIHIAALRPTQACVGLLEVAAKVEDMLKRTPDSLDKYIRKHVVPVVLVGDQFYMTDHHHFVRALSDSDQLPNHCYLNVTAVLAPGPDLWQRMVELGWFWPFDALGQLLDPLLLPTSAAGLVDDIYRSLVNLVQEQGAIDKSPLPFAQFLWANYFRAALPLPLPPRNCSVRDAGALHAFDLCCAAPHTAACLPPPLTQPALLAKVLPAALAIAHAPAAQRLPGYRP